MQELFGHTIIPKYNWLCNRDHEPDIIVITTPHGINLSDTIGIYASRIGVGTADWNNAWADYKVSCNFHDEFAMDIYNHLQESVFYAPS